MGALSKLRLLLIMMSAVQQRVDVLQADQEAASQPSGVPRQDTRTARRFGRWRWLRRPADRAPRRN